MKWIQNKSEYKTTNKFKYFLDQILLESIDFWPSNWFWYKAMWIKQKINKRTRWRLYTWFKLIKRIRRSSKSNSTIRICWTNKKLGDDNATDGRNCDQSMFVLTILEKIKEARLKISQGSVTVL